MVRTGRQGRNGFSAVLASDRGAVVDEMAVTTNESSALHSSRWWNSSAEVIEKKKDRRWSSFECDFRPQGNKWAFLLGRATAGRRLYLPCPSRWNGDPRKNMMPTSRNEADRNESVSYSSLQIWSRPFPTKSPRGATEIGECVRGLLRKGERDDEVTWKI